MNVPNPISHGLLAAVVFSSLLSAADADLMLRKGGILDSGGVVLAIDAFQTGTPNVVRETSKPGFEVFNRTNDANPVQDILTAITYQKARTKHDTVNVIGLGTAGVWTYFARALAGPGVDLPADLNYFETDRDSEYLDKFFCPGLRRAGDFVAGAVLAAQVNAFMANAPASFPPEWMYDSAAVSRSRLTSGQGNCQMRNC